MFSLLQLAIPYMLKLQRVLLKSRSTNFTKNMLTVWLKHSKVTKLNMVYQKRITWTLSNKLWEFICRGLQWPISFTVTNSSNDNFTTCTKKLLSFKYFQSLNHDSFFKVLIFIKWEYIIFVSLFFSIWCYFLLSLCPQNIEDVLGVSNQGMNRGGKQSLRIFINTKTLKREGSSMLLLIIFP